MATIPSLPLFTSGPLTSGKLNRLRDVIALWQNPPAAMARASASQNITTGGAYQLVTLHTTEFDTDTIVTSTTRFTVKTAGRYLIAATATFSANGTGSRYVTVRKNAAGSPTGGTVIASGASAPSAGSSTTVSLPANLRTQLAVNDTLEVFVFQDSGATLTLNSSPGDTFMLLQLDSVTATLSGTEATNIQSLHAESDLSTGDLDSVLSPGNYVQATAANATLARHYPVASVGGHLQVQSDGTASPTSTTQMFETTANALYIRHRAGTTWSAWSSGGGGSSGTAGGDLSGTYPNPTVAKVNGVAVTGTPTLGQIITATSGTAATWQTPSGGTSLALSAPVIEVLELNYCPTNPYRAATAADTFGAVSGAAAGALWGLARDVTITEIAVQLTASGSAGTDQFAIYSATADGLIGTLVWNANQTDTTVGVKSWTGLSLNLPKGTYWTVAVRGTGSNYTCAAPNATGPGTAVPAVGSGSYNVGSVAGTVPSTWSNTSYAVHTRKAPLLYLYVSAVTA